MRAQAVPAAREIRMDIRQLQQSRRERYYVRGMAKRCECELAEIQGHGFELLPITYVMRLAQ
jgi:hypothetical protein